MKRKIILKDAYKGYTLDLDKVVPPEETVRRFKEKLRTIDLDILKETVRIDNGRLDIPVYFSLCGRDAEGVIGTKKQMGKGGTPHQAEASAVMELAERFSLFSFYKEPKNFFVEEYRNLKDRAVPFESIAQSVHDDLQEIDVTREIFSQIPLKWTWGYNLTEGEEVLLPFNWFFTINEFNGSAAGNCQEEALLQGICEVIERHVSSIISRDKLTVPHIDLRSVTDPLALDLIQKFEQTGIQLYASSFSLNTGIPSVGVLAYDPVTFPEKSEIVWTAGTTPDPQKSLIRALTEVAQLAGDFNTNSNYVASGLPKFKNLTEADFVMDPEKKIPLSNMPNLSNTNIRVEVEACLATLSKTGMDVIAVDVTHPEIEIPAFYTVIPGAHFRERSAGTGLGMFSAKLIADSADQKRTVDLLKKMDKLLPDKYYIKFYLGMSKLTNHAPRSALEYFDEALKLDPKDEDVPSIYSYMGLSFKELELYHEAIKALAKANEFDHERTDVHNLMGFCFYKLKEHEKAIKCFRKVLQINPGSAIDYANIASNFRELGDKKQAVRYYEFALELDPTIDFARRNLDKLHIKPPN